MGATDRLIHTFDERLELRHGDQTLFTYVYAPDLAAYESPQPYFHPLRTLAGELVTIHRPHDHRWHKGLAMTSAHLSGENFWGGPTYVNGQGYVQLPNNGRMIHRTWEALGAPDGLPTLRERLDWVTQAGETWLTEERDMAVAEINDADGYWTLNVASTLTNVRDAPLHFGSPTTVGRPLAGYGGLFWRGPRSFLGGRIMASEGRNGPELMGQRSPWLAFVGRHDGSDRASTILFLDHPANPRYPTQWFVRNDPYACVSFAFMFDEELTLAPGETLGLHYRIVIADGDWTPERIGRYCADRPLLA